MSNPIKAVCLMIVLALLLQACDININMANTSSIPPIALTITAQAAILQQGAQQPVNPSNVTPTAANVNPTAQANPNLPSSTSTNTPAPVSAAATNTPVQGGPVTVQVTVETNCRSGPGLNFPSVYSLSVSQVAEVIGKNTFNNYWIIKIPGSNSTCWLWGKYATVSGNTAALVEFATPTPAGPTGTKTAKKVPGCMDPKATNYNSAATADDGTCSYIGTAFTGGCTDPKATNYNSAATADDGSCAYASNNKPPVAPSNLQVTNKSCADQGNGKTKYTGTVTWTDNSNDELGFSITMPGFADTVGANVTTYNFDVNLFNISYAMGSTITVEVTELSQTSTAASHITFSCP
jgi:hypothetical protein